MLMCGPAGPERVRIASGEDDNHFAGCASLADIRNTRSIDLVIKRGMPYDPDDLTIE